MKCVLFLKKILNVFQKQETYADTDFQTYRRFQNGNKVDFCFFHGEVHVWKRLNTLPLRLRLPVYTAWTCGCSLVSSPWLFVPTYTKVGFASALLPLFLLTFCSWCGWQASRRGQCSCEVWSEGWTGLDLITALTALTDSPMHFGSFKL